MAWPEDNYAIEALGPNRTDPALGISIRLRRPPGRADDLDPLGLEDLVEGRTEALVAIVHEEADEL